MSGGHQKAAGNLDADVLTEDTHTKLMANIEEIAAQEGRSVTLQGWLHNRRSSGKIHFLTVRDGTGFIQAVMSKAAVGEELFVQAGHLGQETAVTIEGTVRADARAPGGYELDVSGLRVVGPTRDYPITPKEHGVDFLLDRRHLWIRSERQHAILRIRHTVINAVRDYLNTQGFILADTPIFTPAACEGTTTLPHFSPRAASSTTKPTPWRSDACTPSVRRSGRRNRRPAVT